MTTPTAPTHGELVELKEGLAKFMTFLDSLPPTETLEKIREHYNMCYAFTNATLAHAQGHRHMSENTAEEFAQYETPDTEEE